MTTGRLTCTRKQVRPCVISTPESKQNAKKNDIDGNIAIKICISARIRKKKDIDMVGHSPSLVSFGPTSARIFRQMHFRSLLSYCRISLAAVNPPFFDRPTPFPYHGSIILLLPLRIIIVIIIIVITTTAQSVVAINPL